MIFWFCLLTFFLSLFWEILNTDCSVSQHISGGLITFNKSKDKNFLGLTILVVGLVLLVFTFVSAFVFLYENVQIVSSEDLSHTFGDAFEPLVATFIRVMYLGIMGWIGSLITVRGMNIMFKYSDKAKSKVQERTDDQESSTNISGSMISRGKSNNMNFKGNGIVQLHESIEQ